MLDALIIGGGPAGATAARLLAQCGHSVAILTAPPAKRLALAECLPPSNRKLFRFLGIDDEIARAGFFRTTGNTVWWGGSRRRVEAYPQGWGYQVLRSDFDRLLLELARSAGARIRIGVASSARTADGTSIELQANGKRTLVRARFILDCSGRTGVIGRSLRVKEKDCRTVALCGVWRNESGWKLPDAGHTLVEAYTDGWAWSVPVSASVRYVAFMVGPGETRILRGKGLHAAYTTELAKTHAFRRIFSRGTLEGKPWGCDASLYTSNQFCGPDFLLAGDAGSFIDPLSSFGVKKAMASGWVAAVVANTWLRRPSMRQVALQFYDERERSVYADYRRQSSHWFRLGAERDPHPFWTHRSEFADRAAVEDWASVQTAFEMLKRKQCIRLRRAESVRVACRPTIEGREIVLQDVLIAPGLDRPLDYINSVHLPALARIAEQHTHVPDLFEAYNRSRTPVTLPDFLTALATLIAKDILLDT